MFNYLFKLNKGVVMQVGFNNISEADRSNQIEQTPSVFNHQQRFDENRPLTVLEKINEKFEHAQKIEHYPVQLQEVYEFGFSSRNCGLTSEDFLSYMKRNCFSKPWKVLDVGAGSGNFINGIMQWNGLIEATGISASDLRSSQPKKGNYLLGNAELILEHPELKHQRFSGIVSAYTMMHLVDPLGTLSQLYEMLEPGGVLCVDSFTCYGLNGYLTSIIEFLNKQGYHISCGLSDEDNSKGKFLFLFIEKTNDHLNFPVKYKEYNDRKGLLKYEVAFTLIPRNEGEESKIIEPEDRFDQKGNPFSSFSYTFRRKAYFKTGHAFEL